MVRVVASSSSSSSSLLSSTGGARTRLGVPKEEPSPLLV
jgi:hypothetical protein